MPSHLSRQPFHQRSYLTCDENGLPAQAALGTPQQVALRGRIVIAAGGGKPEAAIAAEMKVNRKTVRLWCERFAA